VIDLSLPVGQRFLQISSHTDSLITTPCPSSPSKIVIARQKKKAGSLNIILPALCFFFARVHYRHRIIIVLVIEVWRQIVLKFEDFSTQ
jgi:hypothetical protein